MQTLTQAPKNSPQEPNEFLGWLANRLQFKFKEDPTITNSLNNILSNYKLIPKRIPIELIDEICKKHYPDFDLEKVSDLNMGYTNKERMQIRDFVIDIIKLATKPI